VSLPEWNAIRADDAHLVVRTGLLPGARAFYDARRATGDTHHRALRAPATASSGSSTAAATTAPFTTNKPPGPTARELPLDTNGLWDV
jgi:hypothetical protein